MKRALTAVVMVCLLLQCVLCYAESVPEVSFCEKNGHITGGFEQYVVLDVHPAANQAMTVYLQDEDGVRYSTVVAEGETRATVKIPTRPVEKGKKCVLTLETGEDYTVGKCSSYTMTLDRLPAVRFAAKVYYGALGKKATIATDYSAVKGSSTEECTFLLKDHLGNVLDTKKVKTASGRLNFSVNVTKELIGRHDLSVWCGDYCVSDSVFCSFINTSDKVIRKVDTTEPYMAITIDCNWYNAHGEEILDVLDKYGIKVTFFLTGNYMRLFPETVERMIASGHEIANHSNTHMRQTENGIYTKLREIQIPNEIQCGRYGIKARYFRPPYGAFDTQTIAIARGMGMEVCLWSIDSKDWLVENQHHPEKILARVTKDVVPGTIILFHIDGYGTAQTLDTVIPYYMNDLGLMPVPVSELIKLEERVLPPMPEGVYGSRWDEEKTDAPDEKMI